MKKEITDLEKARAVMFDKNNSFKKLHEVSGCSVSRLRHYRCEPELLETARWITIHRLASLYDEIAKRYQ